MNARSKCQAHTSTWWNSLKMYSSKNRSSPTGQRSRKLDERVLVGAQCAGTQVREEHSFLQVIIKLGSGAGRKVDKRLSNHDPLKRERQ
jgi:hypothetical protein